MDLEGSSCSLNTSPQNYFYAYGGNTTTYEYSKTLIYHTAHVNLTTDASISAFSGLFDANGITAASLSLAQTQFSISFISKSSFIGTFEPMTAIGASSSAFQPQASLVIEDYQSGAYKVRVSNVKANVPSTAYLVLVSFKNITTNQVTSTTTITIKPLVIPTEDQIASCLDGGSYPAVQCRRVAMLSGSSYSFYFDNLV